MNNYQNQGFLKERKKFFSKDFFLLFKIGQNKCPKMKT